MSPPAPSDPPIGSSRGVYGISVAAELVGRAPQDLRLYEARGLLSPARSDGGTRRYSNDDLDRLREIGRLLDNGLNLAGIAAVLALQAANRALQAELDHARQAASMSLEERDGIFRGRRSRGWQSNRRLPARRGRLDAH
jgi:MerR family transcriptional regulator, heat shock protein HspR